MVLIHFPLPLHMVSLSKLGGGGGGKDHGPGVYDPGVRGTSSNSVSDI